MSLSRVALFVSPHGLGHATRAAAVGAALERHLSLEIFTTIPRALFAQSLVQPFGYHHERTDVGLIQTSPLEVDLTRSLQALAAFLPFDPATVARLAAEVRALACELILCDIAPLGIAVAQAAGLRSVLIENFTWDWIYRPYAGAAPRMDGLADYLAEIFQSATYHIQTEPICRPTDADLVTAPVSRMPRRTRAAVRAPYGIPTDDQVVLITMGGLDQASPALRRLGAAHPVWFLIPTSGSDLGRDGRMLYLPHSAETYHPDLIAASDAVVGKVGYSTLAEVYHAGIAFGYIARPDFRESAPLVRYIERELEGRPMRAEAFVAGDWIAELPDLLALPRRDRVRPNGAQEIATFITGLLAPGRAAPPSCGRS